MSRIKSANQAHFAQVPSANIQRSSFNRSHGHKTTMDAGYLVPVFLDEVLPGDTFNLKMTSLGRLATPISPVMDNIYQDTQFWFVPMRLLWTNFKKFMGEQIDPGDSIAFTIPQSVSPGGGYTNSSLQDYLGIPTLIAAKTHNTLPLRAYNLIYNEWYRDENLQDSLVVDVDDGPDTVTDYVLRRRGKRHDYFTSCLPWAQKGTAVSLPLGTSAPIILDPTTAGDDQLVRRSSDYTLSGAFATLGTNAASSELFATVGGGVEQVIDPNGTLIADLTAATAATINTLRESFQVQKLLERDARGGTRYTEIILSHFSVKSPDARLQRPELLSTSSQRINISPIAQTSETLTGTPQGNLSAIGTVSASNKGFVKSFTEHGYIIGLTSVRADLNYQQGLNKLWSCSTRYDFYWPAFANLGEQVVLTQEIYCDASATDDDVFGYQERFAEYRFKPNQITAQFRSNFAQSLDVWHLAQDFGAAPVLNASFIVEDPPIDRVIATTTFPHLIMDIHFDLKCARPMPVYSVPGLIDHF